MFIYKICQYITIYLSIDYIMYVFFTSHTKETWKN